MRLCRLSMILIFMTNTTPITKPPTPTLTTMPCKEKKWSDAWRIYTEPMVLRMLLLGFASGLPILLVWGGSLGFWLSEAGLKVSMVAQMTWIGLIYGFKWAWSPLVDSLKLPWLHNFFGRRRSWLMLSQMVVMMGLFGMAMNDPKLHLQELVWFALLAAFASATQDIALDAYRIESATVEKQAALSSAYTAGYRMAMVWAGAGVFWVAAFFETNNRIEGIAHLAYDYNAWKMAYIAMAISMLMGLVTVLFSVEPQYKINQISHQTNQLASFQPNESLDKQSKFSLISTWLQTAICAPFVDFFARYKSQALLILALIATYRLSDIVMGSVTTPFYVSLHYTKIEYANITKIYGVLMTITGSFIGGALAVRWGVMRVLMLGAALSAMTNLLFAWLAGQGHNVSSLMWVISADNLAGGLATAAFIAYMSSLTNIQYSATQYALFSSMMVLVPKYLAGQSGEVVERMGYAAFFNATALLGLPVLVLIYFVNRANKKQRRNDSHSHLQTQQ